MEIPAKTVFYTIERTIKTYRRFSKQNFSKVVNDITVDQKLILQYLNDRPELSQNEIAELVFKDNASLTRMIELMVRKRFLKRSIRPEDRRRFNIELTSKGKEILEKLTPVIAENRKRAFAGITEEELAQLQLTLNKILTNLNHT
ncbi:MarR family winged helix-turn-helix transcriptional regulator [Flagellimonas aequoris]|uniref:MarR family transcriptional regulator n=1 Tax=Flagellimonas aequoris TaxID=2306997 RepID=A0A418N7W5_9FLAO|nr:MarR family transcriptional regulator [Allomuricauda aequoris]RIV71132.1 MarR family transcriptional regulator [Allomuricauda aequoris]TXK02507.1 MarR family transcriptional regulator [Allomuricauda aequoris]